MLQLAIKLTKNNADYAAADLIDFTGQELLDECNYMLERGINVVFVKSVIDGVSTYSHTVSESMFYANARPVSELNETTFVEVVQL